MQTRFTAQQLTDPGVAESEKILRACVHCGFCIATCPTYVLLGDELDSPRGRIYLIKDMLEQDRPATEEVVRHIDRCLSCLACMTSCPSGVHYQHLIDHARVHVERTYRRPWPERLLRGLLAWMLPHPRRFRFALRLAALARPVHALLPERLRAMTALAPRHLPRAAASLPAASPAVPARTRVALLTGCVQPVIAPQINEATVRLLTRAGAEVIGIPGCCGAIVHHLGRETEAHALAAAVIERVHEQMLGPGLDAVVMNASGCGTQVKDYAYLLRGDGRLAAKAAAVSRLSRDVTEVLAELGLPEPRAQPAITVAYHSACSMQHGQKLEGPPRELLAAAGFSVEEIPEGHLCCGSAGTYNLLQPAIADRLRARKLANIASTTADVVATGNVGCITQLAADGSLPVVHTVELLDWACGGPRPAALAGLDARGEAGHRSGSDRGGAGRGGAGR